MFNVGDTVVHPTQGVGIIQNLLSVPALSKKSKYYKIDLVSDKHNTTLMVPVKRATQLGLRHTVSEADVNEVWEVLTTTPEILPEHYRTRYQVLREKLRQSELLPTAEIVRDLAWRRKQKGKLNAPAKKLYDKALGLLVDELAVSTEVKPQTAKRHIKDQLHDSFEQMAEDEV